MDDHCLVNPSLICLVGIGVLIILLVSPMTQI